VSIHVRALERQEVLFDRQGDTALNPASNHKLLTAIAAVELLGNEYRFATRVRWEGSTLYLIGEGDPSLQLEHLYALANRVGEALHGETVQRIVVDDGAFSPEFFGPGFSSAGEGHSYTAPSGALSLHFNTVEVRVSPTRTGERVIVGLYPPCDHVHLENTAKTGNGMPLSIESRARGDHTHVIVRGTLPHSSDTVVVRRRVFDPGLYTGTVFAELLANLTGSDIPHVVRGRTPDTAQAIANHESAPLPEVLAPALKFSNNFTTEQVLRTLGWRTSGLAGSWSNGRAALERFWAAIGEPAEALSFENGSGFSRSGRLTTHALVDLVALAQQDGAPSAELLAMLPTGGRDGTLVGRLRGSDGRVRAKTGTLAGVAALTGIAAARDGTKRIGFSVLVNGPASATPKARRLQDAIVSIVLEHLDRNRS